MQINSREVEESIAGEAAHTPCNATSTQLPIREIIRISSETEPFEPAAGENGSPLSDVFKYVWRYVMYI